MSKFTDLPSGEFDSSQNAPFEPRGWMSVDDDSDIDVPTNPQIQALMDKLAAIKQTPEKKLKETETLKKLLISAYREAALYLQIQRRSEVPGYIDLGTGAVRLISEDADFIRLAPEGNTDQRENSYWLNMDEQGDIIFTMRKDDWLIPEDWPSLDDVNHVDSVEDVAMDKLRSDLAYLDAETLIPESDKQTQRLRLLFGNMTRRFKRLMKENHTSEERQHFLQLLEHGQRVRDEEASYTVEVARIPANMATITDRQTIEGVWRDVKRHIMDVRGEMRSQIRIMLSKPGAWDYLERQYDENIKALYKQYFVDEFRDLGQDVPAFLQKNEITLSDINAATKALSEEKNPRSKERREHRKNRE